MPRGLAVRLITYTALDDFIPFYAVYSLLFVASGLSVGAVSSLYILWSLTAVVLEVPSGAWADTVSRRRLLAGGPALKAAGFACWVVVPSYPGFAVGFVLWGAGSALISGTREALAYDELAAVGAESRYAWLSGWAASASTVAILVATFLAAPLYAVGGYSLVGWSSVTVCLLQGALALGLPRAPAVEEVDETADVRGAGVFGRYRTMLRAGLREVAHTVGVRHAVLLCGLIYGLNTHDEYFALVAGEAGAAVTTVALLVGLTSVGEAVGTALAGRTVGMARTTIAGLLVLAGALFAVGALLAGWLGFLALAVASGVHNNLIVVTEARLQDAIEGPARATVTSINGLLVEVVAIATFVVYTVGAPFASVAVLVAVMGVPVAATSVLARRWLPGRPRDTETGTHA